MYERAIDVDHRNITVWLKYAEMEMRHKQINHARNIWDRAVTILPRANQFWYKYSYMEEMLGNIAGARQVHMEGVGLSNGGGREFISCTCLCPYWELLNNTSSPIGTIFIKYTVRSTTYAYSYPISTICLILIANVFT